MTDKKISVNPCLKECGLKKQSQFPVAHISANSFLKGDYGDMPVHGIEENKAKQSQYSASKPVKEAGKREKSVTAATG